MLSFIFMILMIMVFGKLFIFGVKAAWGVTRILFTIVLLPAFLICLVLGGLMSLAFPILIIVGFVALFCKIAG